MSKERFICRKKRGTGFVYFDGDDKVTDERQLERIRHLAIPPAWTDVRIARSPRAKVQASGRDDAGRKQMIYSEAFRQAQDQAKYERIVAFAKTLGYEEYDGLGWYGVIIQKPVSRDEIEKKLTDDGI